MAGPAGGDHLLAQQQGIAMIGQDTGRKAQQHRGQGKGIAHWIEVLRRAHPHDQNVGGDRTEELERREYRKGTHPLSARRTVSEMRQAGLRACERMRHGIPKPRLPVRGAQWPLRFLDSPTVAGAAPESS